MLLFVAAAHAVAGAPLRAEAITEVNGNVYSEDAVATRPGGQSNVLQTGVNVSIQPPVKKKVSSSLNLRFNYVRTDEEALADFSPLGNIGFDMNGEAFALNAARTQYAAVGTNTELTETKLSRASLALTPKEWPRLAASYSQTETTTGSGVSTRGDTGSLSLDYQYRWAEARAGYTADHRESGATSNDSSSQFAGLRGTYEILPATLVMGDVGLSRFESRALRGSSSTTLTSTILGTAESQPLSWIRLNGNYSRTVSDVDSSAARIPSTSVRMMEGGATLIPHPSLHLGATVGNRRFNDVQAVRNVDYRILSAGFAQQLELRERILVGANVSRSFESDPLQGENITDNVGVSFLGDLVPRVSLRLAMGVSRSESRSFVSAPQTFGASGSLADRDRLDLDSGGLPAGFTFFDVVNNDLYTKNSSAIGDWSLPVHSEPVVKRFGVTRTVQVNAAPTDRVNVTVSYGSGGSSDHLDLTRAGAQTLSGSLAYLATRRASFGVSGTSSFPERGIRSYSTTGSFAYRLLRGHQLSLSYGRQYVASRYTDSAGATLTLRLRKRLTADLNYSATQLFRDAQTQFVRVRLTSSF
jgi:hypothetical protein